jgi:hypothetical protein
MYIETRENVIGKNDRKQIEKGCVRELAQGNPVCC